MSLSLPLLLLRVYPALVLMLVLPSLGSGQTLGRGEWRHGLQLQDGSTLSERSLASAAQCVALCGRQDGCKAIQYQTLSPGKIICQTFSDTACTGLTSNQSRLVTAADFHYMDVSSDLVTSRTERQQIFWDDPGCQERGYCDPTCAVSTEGDFCPAASDRYCLQVQPSTRFVCLDNTCQLDPRLWRIPSNGVILPRWQPWVLDTFLMKSKTILYGTGTCSLRFDLKLKNLGSISMTISSKDGHLANGRDFGKAAFVFDIGVGGNTQTVITRRYQVTGVVYESILITGSTPDILSASETRRYVLSWCDSQASFGPEQQPDLVTAAYTDTNPLGLLLLDISPEAEVVTMQIEKDVADAWLFRSDASTADPEFPISSNAVVLRQLSATPIAETSVTFDVRSSFNTWVMFRETMSSDNIYRVVLGASLTTSRLEVVTPTDTNTVNTYFSASGILSNTVPVTFTVSYKSTASGVQVDVLRNGVTLFSGSFPTPKLIRYIAIGAGCCGVQYFRLARYDPAWGTSKWVTHGSGGFSNFAGLE